jgi:hypothetical protein
MDMNNQQVQNKPTAAYVLSLIGGILGLLASLAFLAFGALAYMSYQSFLSDVYSYSYDLGLFGLGYTYLLGLGVWMLITSILIIVFAGKLKSQPMEHSKWGALILVFSIIGVGGLLAFIGGILALVYKPIPAQQPYGYAPPPAQQYGQQPQPQYYGPQQPPAQQATQRITRICPNCGRVIDENLKFCPHCGKQLG